VETLATTASLTIGNASEHLHHLRRAGFGPGALKRDILGGKQQGCSSCRKGPWPALETALGREAQRLGLSRGFAAAPAMGPSDHGHCDRREPKL